jgi:hypothetical protein
MPPRSLRKSRPSRAAPNSSMWLRRIATSHGGAGTSRTASGSRCLRPRGSCRCPWSVHFLVVTGRVLLSSSSPQPLAGSEDQILTGKESTEAGADPELAYCE